MTTPELVKVETRPELDVYHRSTGGETKTEFWMHYETGKYGLTQAYDDRSTDIDVWENRACEVKLDVRPDGDAARAYLTNPETVALLQTILDGYGTDYNGQGNMVGTLTPEANAALDEIVEALEALPESDWTFWSIRDYLSPANINIYENTTNAEIEAWVSDIQEDCRYQHIELAEDPAEYLYELREAETGPRLTNAQAAALIGITPDHLRRLLIAGKVRGSKPGRDWQIDADEVRGVLPQRRRA